jgi:RimJ/RimL family protein N-acetyltransferase
MNGWGLLDNVNREAYYYDFKWRDRIIFSMLESEWVSLRSS